MWIVHCLGLTFGLLASSWASSIQDVKVRGCSHKGAFYVQGSDRHSLSFTEAEELCKSLGATLASKEQLEDAHKAGMEICRYGWINSGNISIVRQNSNPLCRAGHTGVIVFSPINVTYDAFCYNDTDDSEKDCTFAMNLESTLDPVPKPKVPEVPTASPTTADEEEHTESPTDSSSKEDSRVVFVAETTDIPDEETTIPITLDSGMNGAVVDAQTTQFSTLFETADPADSIEVLATESTAQSEPQTQPTVGKRRPITSLPPLETTGSGMGEITTIIPKPTGDGFTDDHITTTTDETENEFTGSEPSVIPGGRGRMMIPPVEDNKESSSSDWLVIVGVIVAVAAILLVCAAVATRKRWCGKSQTLMITSKSSSEGNGTAASASSSRAQEREQEMVTLMNKEKIQENGNTEEFTVITLEESPEKSQQA